MPVRLTETTPLSEAGTGTAKSGRMKVRAISAGIGSSGYYSPQVLEQAAKDQLITEGTHLYLDHPTDVEAVERPGRSVRDIAAVFTEAATYDAGTESLVGEIKVMAPYRDLLEDLAPHIGLSIRGSATDVTEGEHDGQPVKVIEGLHSIDSVDFVTKAGRGGQVIELLESADANRRAIGHGISEATVNDTREALQTALRDAYGAGERTYVWVRDFDDETVWFEVEATDSGLYAQTYEQTDNGAVSLTGDRTEVRVRTTYVPVARPGSTTTEESEEDTMPNTQIEEAELARLNETAGRVETLESERDTAIRERDELRAREAATGRARTRVTEANADLAPATVERIVVEATRTVPLTDAGALDETALDAAVDAARTAEESYLAGLAQASGAGTVSGYGGTTQSGDTEISESDIDNVVAGAFGRTVKEA